MKVSIKLIYLISFSIIIALIINNWFSDYQFIFGVDTIFPLDRAFLNEYFYIWSNKVALGGVDIFKLPVMFPYAFFFQSFVNITGFYRWDLYERFMIYLLMLAGGIGAFLLSAVSFKNNSNLSHLIATLFYSFNLYVVYILVPMPIYLMFSYYIFPLILAGFIYFIQSEEKLLIRYKSNLYFLVFISAAISYFLISTSYATTPYIILHIGVMLLYCIFSILKSISTKKHAILVFFIYSATFGILSLSWIIPFLLTPNANLTNIVSYLDDGFSSYKLNSSSISDVFLFRGYFGFNEEYNGTPYYKWFSTYKTYWVMIAGLALAFLVFRPVIFKIKSTAHKNYLFYIYLILIFVTLVIVVKLPFSNSITYVLDKIGYFNFFRTAYQRFTGFIVLGYAMSLAYSFDIISEKIKSKNRLILKYLFAAGIAVLIIFNSLPLFSRVPFEQNDIFPSKALTIPNEYIDVSNYLDKNADINTNVLILPLNKLGIYALSWSDGKRGYEGLHPFFLMGKFRLIYADVFIYPFAGLLDRYVNDKAYDFSSISKSLNVGHLIVHKDLNIKTSSNNSWWIGREYENLQNKIEVDKCLTLVKENAFLEVYEVRSECKEDKFNIYDAKNAVLVHGGEEYLRSLLLFNKIFNKDDLLINCYDLKNNCPNISREIITGHEVIDYKTVFKDRSGLQIPNIKFKPGTIFYDINYYKEKLQRRLEGAKIYEKINTTTWYLSKRIEEFTKWDVDAKEKSYLALKIQSEANSIKYLFGLVLPDKKDAEFYDNVDKTLFYVKRSKGDVKDADVSKVLNDLTNYLESNYEYTNNCSDRVCYKYNIFNEGEYILTNVDEKTNQIKYKLDGNDVLSNHAVSLNKGVHYLQISDEAIVSHTFPDISLRLEKVPTSLYSRRYETVSEFNIPDWSVDNIYDLSFQYNVVNGTLYLAIDDKEKDYSDYESLDELFKENKGGFANWGDQLVSVVERDLTNNEKSNIKFRLLPANLSKNKGKLKFIFVFDKNQSLADVNISDVKIVKRPDYKILLNRQVRDLTNDTNFTMPKIDYVRINPTMYRVNFDGPISENSYLVFKEKFDPGWDIYTKQQFSVVDSIVFSLNKIGATILGQAYPLYGYKKSNFDNIQANMLDNSYYISNSNGVNNEIYLYYTPQNTLYFGILASIFGFCIFAVIIKKFIHKI